MDIFYKIISEICQENEIKLDLLSFDWIYELKKDGLVRHIVGRNFDLNKDASAQIVSDKYACYEVLHKNRVPVIDHLMLFNPLTRPENIENSGSMEKAREYFFQNNQRVVVKPNNGFQGKNVFLCENQKELEQAIQSIFLRENSLSISPFANIKYEYRAFVLKQKSLYVYRKEPAYLIGDGITNVGELLKLKNISEDHLFKNIKLSYIPLKGEKYSVTWKHNLNNGATATQVKSGELLFHINELAQKAAKFVNIDFATVDIVLLNSGDLRVIEINSGVVAAKFLEQSPGQYETIKSIYSAAILKMFL